MHAAAEQKLAVVIEDDADIRNLLRTILVQSGFEPILTSNGTDGLDAVRVHEPVLTTLDISMPGMDGFAVAKRIREFSGTYIIMLTGQTDEIDIVQGLDSGADDYLVKPFRPRELRARIESLMRRPRQAGDSASLSSASEDLAAVLTTDVQEPAPVQPQQHQPQPQVQPQQPQSWQPQPQQQQPSQPQPQVQPQQPQAEAHPDIEPVAEFPVAGAPSPAAEAPVAEARPADPAVSEILHSRGLTVNTATRTATVNDKNVDLTRSEFDLLASLLASGRRVRSKADLVLMLRGEGYVTTYYVNDADKRAIEVHVANLRRKIGDSSSTPRWIETVRGVGYRMASD